MKVLYFRLTLTLTAAVMFAMVPGAGADTVGADQNSTDLSRSSFSEHFSGVDIGRDSDDRAEVRARHGIHRRPHSNAARIGDTTANVDLKPVVSTSGDDSDDQGESSENVDIDTSLPGTGTAPVRASAPVASPTPEPSSMLLFGTGLSLFAATLRRHVKKQHRPRGWRA